MADVKNSTWREQRITVPQSQVKEIFFIDTEPNHVIIANNSGGNVYVCSLPQVNTSNFDIIIPAYGKKLYAKELPFKKIFVYTEVPGGASLHVISFYGPFNPASIAQTQEIVGVSAGGLLGVVDINNIINPLPAGTNKIGQVDISGFGAALPAGANKIGKVDVDLFLNPLPAGNNNIGDVDVVSLPDLNVEGVALASAARTATTNSADLVNKWKKGVIVVIDITAVTGTPSLTLKIQGKDPASGKYYDILTSAALTAVGTTVLKVFPGATAAANQVANDLVPKTWRVRVEHVTADSVTYSVGYVMV